MTFVIGHLTFLLACLAYGQQAGQDLAVLKAGVGARPLGMGGAFTAVADDANSPYWNPAGLGFVDFSEITSMQTRLSTDADHYYLSCVQPALGGTLGVSWVQVGVGSIARTSLEVDPNNEVVNLGVFSYFSNAYLLSYGRKISDRLSIGLTGKYLASDMQQIQGGQASGYSLSPAIMMRFGGDNVGTGLVPVRTERTTTRVVPTLTIGLKIDELLNSQTWGTGATEQVPPKARLGASYREPRGLLAGSLFSLDLAQMLRSGYAATAALGYEWAREGIALRLGYADGLTAGAGFISGPARVDYAYVTQMDLSRDNVHRISLSGRW